MTFEKVKEIIMDTINCSEDKITLEANLITVPEEELPNLTSVKAIVEYVDKNAA